MNTLVVNALNLIFMNGRLPPERPTTTFRIKENLKGTRITWRGNDRSFRCNVLFGDILYSRSLCLGQYDRDGRKRENHVSTRAVNLYTSFQTISLHLFTMSIFNRFVS